MLTALCSHRNLFVPLWNKSLSTLIGCSRVTVFKWWRTELESTTLAFYFNKKNWRIFGKETSQYSKNGKYGLGGPHGRGTRKELRWPSMEVFGFPCMIFLLLSTHLLSCLSPNLALVCSKWQSSVSVPLANWLSVSIFQFLREELDWSSSSFQASPCMP